MILASGVGAKPDRVLALWITVVICDLWNSRRCETYRGAMSYSEMQSRPIFSLTPLQKQQLLGHGRPLRIRAVGFGGGYAGCALFTKGYLLDLGVADPVLALLALVLGMPEHEFFAPDRRADIGLSCGVDRRLPFEPATLI